MKPREIRLAEFASPISPSPSLPPSPSPSLPLSQAAQPPLPRARPCVIISPNDMNDHLRTVIVAPMTTGSRPAAFRIPLTFQGKHGLTLLDKLRTLDRVRLVRRLGAIRPQTLALTHRTLQEMFAP